MNFCVCEQTSGYSNDRNGMKRRDNVVAISACVILPRIYFPAFKFNSEMIEITCKCMHIPLNARSADKIGKIKGS